MNSGVVFALVLCTTLIAFICGCFLGYTIGSRDR